MSLASRSSIETAPTTATELGCAKCIITRADFADLELGDDGICNICKSFQKKWAEHGNRQAERQRLLEDALTRVKRDGVGKAYDCVIGISGGVDSSFLAWKVMDLGLRPLAVHFDNGWNSELAVMNIENLTNALGIDLHTHVVNWPEFRDLQKAYFAASVIDIEVPTDHGIYGTLYRVALKNNVKYIIGGNNVATEGFMVPGWYFQKLDHINLLDIHRRYGTNSLSTYPLCGRTLKRKAKAAGVQLLEILDLIDYSRDEAVVKITSAFNWRDYGVKHGESTFTKFYQEYVLPRKFGVRKRKAHLSTLINTGELAREDALSQLASSVYSDIDLAREKDYVLKKLGYTDAEFDQIMKSPPVDHLSFETEGSLFYEYRSLLPLRSTWESFRNLFGIKRRGRSGFEMR